jgi:hypothetical protein
MAVQADVSTLPTGIAVTLAGRAFITPPNNGGKFLPSSESLREPQPHAIGVKPNSR